MATVTLTNAFSNLNNWQGDLLWAPSGTSIVRANATTFAYSYAAGHPFAGFTVTIKGTGFIYNGTTPTAGDMAKLIVTDTIGTVVLTVAGIAANSLASDLSLFAAYGFGWTDPNGGGAGPQTKNAWSQLLSGNDVINGTSGGDGRYLPGMGQGNDTYNLGDGNDWAGGSMGKDTIDGGNGDDGLSFSETHYNEGMAMTQGIVVDVAAGTVIDAWGNTDSVISIEKYEGSAFNDVFVGGTDNDAFWGLRGKDTFDGGDNLSLGDWVYYDNDQWFGGLNGIVVNLQNSVVGANIKGTIRDGFGALDRTINIENVAGTRFADSFTGSDQINIFSGGEGKDTFDGGLGSDIVWFFWNHGSATSVGVNINLSLANNQVRNDGFGNVETLISIENVVGSDRNDLIKGSAGANVLEGYYGTDTLTGGGGNDEFKFYWRDNFGQGDIITDFRATGAANIDKLQLFVSTWGATTTLTLVNGTAATQAVSTFIFNAATQVLSWDEDGTGAIGAVDVATLLGVTALSAANFDLL